MSIAVFAVVLFAAFLHASWNAIVKKSEDKRLATLWVVGMSGLLSGMALPFLVAPKPESWPFIAMSSLCQIVYFLLLERAYRLSDMSRAYPLMRGAAPLLVAMLSSLFIGEKLSWCAWLGIGFVCSGIVGTFFSSRRGDAMGMRYALGNAVVIAAYTLIDGLGVRLSSSPFSYTLWIFFLTAFPMVSRAIIANKKFFCRHAIGYAPYGIIGGTGSLASYSLALWAMTKAPIASVAALRETSVLFGALIAALVLKERIDLFRKVLICLIALGAVMLRLA